MNSETKSLRLAKKMSDTHGVNFVRLPADPSDEEVKKWVADMREKGLPEPVIAQSLMNLVSYRANAPNVKPKGVKKGVSHGADVITVRDEAGEMNMVHPAGMPPDMIGRYKAGFAKLKAKDDLRRRLREKLAKKHEHHTGEECDTCFWDKA